MKNKYTISLFGRGFMQPNELFLNRDSQFWAMVKYASETLGYSDRKSKGAKLLRYTVEQLSTLKIPCSIDVLSGVCDYLNFRAESLERIAPNNLMTRDQAKALFEELLKGCQPKYQLTYNKQKGDKKHPNYFTCIVNLLTEKYLKKDFNSNPRSLCTISDAKGNLVYTLSRWMDGAYPDIHNPIAIWEIKEYYGTTTFGSRVADGVYETLLDGYEINEAFHISQFRIKHYLFVDDSFTWWVKGKSYLCRLIDMVHRGYVDEVIMGKEVVARWPQIIETWQLPSKQ